MSLFKEHAARMELLKVKHQNYRPVEADSIIALKNIPQEVGRLSNRLHGKYTNKVNNKTIPIKLEPERIVNTNANIKIYHPRKRVALIKNTPAISTGQVKSPLSVEVCTTQNTQPPQALTSLSSQKTNANKHIVFQLTPKNSQNATSEAYALNL